MSDGGVAGESAALLANKAKQSPELTADEEARKQWSLTLGSIIVHIFQIILIIFFGVFCNEGSVLDSSSTQDFSTGYVMFTGVLIMMLVGFAYLMTFIGHYKLGSVGGCLLVTVLAFQFSVFTEAFFAQLYAGSFQLITVNIFDMINSLYATAAVLISFGAVIGKTTPTQLLVLSLFELVFYSLNNQVFQQGLFQIADCGGTIVIHLFGAYFGLAVSWMLGLPKTEAKESYTSDIFSFIGTLFLWIYWPSFVGGFLDSGSAQQQRAITNTVLALVGSTTAAFAASVLYSSDGRFRPADIQNATLAGGVAIGSVANLTLSPFTPLLIGFVAGHVSTLGFAKLQTLVEGALDLHDSAGVNNLHGMPAIIGGLASVVVAAYKTTGGRSSDSAVYSSDNGVYQSAYQLAGLVVTLFIALASGLLTGLVMRNVEADVYYKRFSDAVWWQSKSDDAVHLD